MPNMMWTKFIYNPGGSSEASNTADAPAITESKQNISDIKTNGETLEISSCIEKEKNSDHDSSTETIASNSREYCSGEAKIECSEFRSIDADDSIFSEENMSNESLDSVGGIRRRFRPSTNEDRQNSTLLNLEAEFNIKLFLFDFIALFSGLLVSILAIGFGARHIGNCPADLYIPYLVLIMGVLGLFIVFYVLLITIGENFDSLTEKQRTLIVFASRCLFVLWAWEVLNFSSLEVSFDSTAKNYCSHSFYTFTILMNIFSALGFIIGLGLLGSDSDRTSSPAVDDWMIFDNS